MTSGITGLVTIRRIVGVTWLVNFRKMVLATLTSTILLNGDYPLSKLKQPQAGTKTRYCREPLLQIREQIKV